VALDEFVPTEAVDALRLLRLRAAIAAARDPAAEIDLDAVRMAAMDLTADERRYQVVSAAWTRTWLDLGRKRPWRARFAPIARACAPYPIPARYRAVLALQQLAAPAAFLIMGVAIALFVRLT
jgi:hypothetical protein